jgi:hypothetical protein
MFIAMWRGAVQGCTRGGFGGRQSRPPHRVAEAVAAGEGRDRLFKAGQAEMDGPLRPLDLVLEAVLAQDAQVLHGLRVAGDDVDQLAHLQRSRGGISVLTAMISAEQHAMISAG